MTLTDDELTTLITARYAYATSTVGLTEVEYRGRQRRRNSRLAVGAALAAALFAVAGGATVAMNRIDEHQQVAMFNTACEKAYTREAAASLRAAAIPTALGRPVIDVRDGKAAIRLYATAVPGKPTVVFDCARAADGTTSGRLSFRATTTDGEVPPIDAYRVVLPDGRAAIIGWLADPAATVTLTPPEVNYRAGMQLAVSEGYVVVWGPEDAIAQAVLQLADGGHFNVTRDRQHQPWTFQEPEFSDYCVRTIRDNGRGEPVLGLTLPTSPTTAARVYRSRGMVSLCTWQIQPDGDAVSYQSPNIGVNSGSTRKDDGSDGIGIFLSGSGYLVGLTPPQTQSVRLTYPDGAVIDATLGDGVFAAVTARDDIHCIVTMTTPAYVYTYGDGKPRKVRR